MRKYMFFLVLFACVVAGMVPIGLVYLINCWTVFIFVQQRHGGYQARGPNCYINCQYTFKD